MRNMSVKVVPWFRCGCFVCLLAVSAVSIRYDIMFQPRLTSHSFAEIGVSQCGIVVNIRRLGGSHSLVSKMYFVRRTEVGWWPSIHQVSSPGYHFVFVFLPLWIVTLIAGVVAIIGARRRPSRPPGSCPLCGYEDAEQFAICPECGAVAGKRTVLLSGRDQDLP